MEVGIGGTYDSTNILVSPLITAITALGFDHTSILGNTIGEIAWHKAGIMKPGVPCFSAPQKDEALLVLEKRKLEIGASSLKVLGENDLIDDTVIMGKRNLIFMHW